MATRTYPPYPTPATPLCATLGAVNLASGVMAQVGTEGVPDCIAEQTRRGFVAWREDSDSCLSSLLQPRAGDSSRLRRQVPGAGSTVHRGNHVALESGLKTHLLLLGYWGWLGGTVSCNWWLESYHYFHLAVCSLPLLGTGGPNSTSH